jgi:non-ribosomal peptide synthetase component F
MSGEDTPGHCPELSGDCGDRLRTLAARWGRPLHHVVHTIALAVLARQAVDGAVHIRTEGGTSGRLLFPPDLALVEAVRLVGDLVGERPETVTVTTANGDSRLPGRLSLELLARADGTAAVRTTGSERQAARLSHAWHHPYGPDSTVYDVPLVSPEDAADLRRWEENLAPIPATTLDATFAATARALPARTAVSAGEYRLTYGHAEARAARLATALVRQGVQLGEPVVVLSDHPFRTVVGQLAVLKAGAVCLPAGRVTRVRARELAALSGARYVLGGGPGLAPWEPYCRVLAPEEGAESPGRGAEGNSPEPSLPRSGFTDVAYCLADPLGEGRPGAQLSAHDAWGSAALSRIHRAGRASTEIVVSARPWEPVFLSAMWWAFTCGAALHWFNPAERDAHRAAARHLARSPHADALFGPRRYAQVLDAREAPAGSGPRSVVIGGGPCPLPLARRHFARTPDTRLLTEFSGDGGPLPWTARELLPADAARDRAPDLGTPSPNVRVRVLDESGRILPPGLTGELHAEGSALACGTLPPGGSVPKSADPLLGSGRLGRLRPDGRIELTEVSGGASAPGHRYPALRAPSPLGAGRR